MGGDPRPDADLTQMEPPTGIMSGGLIIHATSSGNTWGWIEPWSDIWCNHEELRHKRMWLQQNIWQSHLRYIILCFSDCDSSWDLGWVIYVLSQWFLHHPQIVPSHRFVPCFHLMGLLHPGCGNHISGRKSAMVPVPVLSLLTVKYMHGEQNTSACSCMTLKSQDRHPGSISPESHLEHQILFGQV